MSGSAQAADLEVERMEVCLASVTCGEMIFAGKEFCMHWNHHLNNTKQSTLNYSIKITWTGIIVTL